jgi:putative transposase
MDNGPELIAWALRDWCRLAGTKTPYIEPGSPWENPFVESFNGRVRDELLNGEDFATLTEAQVIVEAWRVEYNTERPHSALFGLTPVEYAHRDGTRATAPVAEVGLGPGVPVVIPLRSRRGPGPCD